MLQRPDSVIGRHTSAGCSAASGRATCMRLGELSPRGPLHDAVVDALSSSTGVGWTG
jgi:hypothetical protein